MIPIRRRTLFLVGVAEAGAISLTAATFILYASRELNLGVERAGLILSVAGFIGLLAPLPAGTAAAVLGTARVTALALVTEALGLASLALASSLLMVAIAVCAFILGQRVSSAVRLALVAECVPQADGLREQARQRSAMFAGVGIGAIGGGLVAWLGTVPAYRVGFAAAAVLCLGGVPPLLIAGRRHIRSAPVGVAIALRDRKYLILAMVVAILGLSESIRITGLAAVVSNNASIGAVTVPIAVGIETIVTVRLQVWASRHAETLEQAVRAEWRAVGLIAVGLGWLALAQASGGILGAVLVAIGAVFFSFGSVFFSAGAVTIGVSCAPREHLTGYLSLFSMARGAQLAVGPALATVALTQVGIVGTVGLALVELAGVLILSRQLGTRIAATAGHTGRETPAT